MRNRILARVASIACYALLGLAFLFAVAPRASADTCPTTDYCSAQATTTAPGTFIGTIGTAAGDFNQIGNITIYNNSADSPCCVVKSGDSPAYYEFYWGGGTGVLDIVGEVGNNGTADSVIDMELDSYGPNQSGGTETLVAGSSIAFPASGAVGAPGTLYDNTLAAGYYSIDTYVGNSEDNVDPTFQVSFTDPPSVPEPSSAGLLGIGLLSLFVLAGVARRRAAGVQVA